MLVVDVSAGARSVVGAFIWDGERLVIQELAHELWIADEGSAKRDHICGAASECIGCALLREPTGENDCPAKPAPDRRQRARRNRRQSRLTQVDDMQVQKPDRRQLTGEVCKEIVH